MRCTSTVKMLNRIGPILQHQLCVAATRSWSISTRLQQQLQTDHQHLQNITGNLMYVIGLWFNDHEKIWCNTIMWPKINIFRAFATQKNVAALTQLNRLKRHSKRYSGNCCVKLLWMSAHKVAKKTVEYLINFFVAADIQYKWPANQRLYYFSYKPVTHR